METFVSCVCICRHFIVSILRACLLVSYRNVENIALFLKTKLQKAEDNLKQQFIGTGNKVSYLSRVKAVSYHMVGYKILKIQDFAGKILADRSLFWTCHLFWIQKRKDPETPSAILVAKTVLDLPFIFQRQISCQKKPSTTLLCNISGKC